jgi:hypothetical protein
VSILGENFNEIPEIFNSSHKVLNLKITNIPLLKITQIFVTGFAAGLFRLSTNRNGEQGSRIFTEFFYTSFERLKL